MIPIIFFLFFALLWSGIRYLLFTRRMAGPWSREGPAQVGHRVRSGNRAVLVVTLAIIVVAAILEALIPGVSEAMQDLQYFVGDAVDAVPALVYESGSGTVSWGFYLAILLGTFVGLVIGTLFASRRYPVLSGLSLPSYL